VLCMSACCHSVNMHQPRCSRHIAADKQQTTNSCLNCHLS
jgi:hypothetical protein